MLKQHSQAAVGLGLVCLAQLATAQLITPPPKSSENPVTEHSAERDNVSVVEQAQDRGLAVDEQPIGAIEVLDHVAAGDPNDRRVVP